MTKRELTSAIAGRTNTTAKQAMVYLEALEAVVVEELEAGRKISVPGFFIASVYERAGRNGRNPVTGETLTIPAKKAVRIKVGKRLKDAVERS